MFEDVPGEQTLYMAIIDEQVKPVLRPAVTQRVFDAVSAQEELSSTELAAASLLLGQYTERRGETDVPGYPLGTNELRSRGVNLSKTALGDLVSSINKATKDLVRTEDTIPAMRTARYAGKEADLNEAAEINAFSFYVRRLDQYPVLNHDQHVELAHDIRAGRRAAAEVVEGGLDASGEHAHLIEKGKLARDTLVLHNLGFAIFIAKGFAGRGIDWDDLVQQANEKLIDAAEMWDPERDDAGKFTSYAGVAIKRDLLILLNDRSLIAVHDKMINKVKSYYEAGAKYREIWGVYPDDDTLVREYDFSRKTLESIRSAIVALNPMQELKSAEPMRSSSEEYEGEDRGVTVGKPISKAEHDPESEILFQQVESDALRPTIDEILATTLREREAGIIKLRFGLEDGIPRTLDEIAQVYEVTPERIRQIEVKTMSKLRHPSRSDRLKVFLG